MSKNRVIATLTKHRATINKFGVKTLAIFGSVARNQAKRQSDIDLLVDFNKPVTLFDFIKLKNFLQRLLKRPVDLVSRDALRPDLRRKILREAIRAT